MNRIRITLALIMICTVGQSQSTLTLQDCRKLAIENNKALKIASEQEQVARYQKKEALMQYFPKLSFSGAYLHLHDKMHLISKSSIPSSLQIPDLTGMGLPIPGLEIPIEEPVRDQIYKMGEIDLRNVWTGGFSLTQPIFAGGKIVAYNDVASYAKELAETMKETKMTDVIIEVDEVYWQVVSLVNKQQLAESYVNLMKKMDSDIENMEKEGVATKADRLSVSVKLNEAEMTLTKANNGVSLSKMLLCEVCGLDMNENIKLADEQIETVPVEENGTIIPDMNTIWADRTEIKSLELGTKIYRKKEAIVRADMLPTVGLTLGYNWLNPNLEDGVRHKFGGMFYGGVLVSVPLNFISGSAKVNAAKAETNIKRFELEEAKEKIKLQVTQSNYKLTEAYKQLKAAHKNTEKADENLRYANVGFEEGVIAASDVMAAHTAWVAAHSELIDAQIDVKLGKVYLKRALGRELH